MGAATWSLPRLFVLAIVLILGLLFFRGPDAFLTPQFVSDEGRHFFAGAFNKGWISIFDMLMGMFHVLPRLVALVALSLLPLEAQPAAYMIATLVVYLVLVAYIFTRGPWTHVGRFFAALAVFFLPLGDELLMTQTNIPWFGGLLLFLVLFGTKARTRLAMAADLVVLVLTAFSGPYALILLPLAAIHYVRQPQERRPRAYYVILAIAGVATVCALAYFGTIERADASSSRLVNRFFVHQFYMQMSYMVCAPCIWVMPFWFVMVSSLLFGGLLLLLAWQAWSSPLSITGYCLLAAGVFFLALLIVYRGNPSIPSPLDYGPRYYLLPSVFLLWTLVSIFERRKAFVPVAIGVLVWSGIQTYYFVEPMRYADLHWRDHVKRIGQSETTVIPIHPEGWEIELTRRKR